MFKDPYGDEEKKKKNDVINPIVAGLISAPKSEVTAPADRPDRIVTSSFRTGKELFPKQLAERAYNELYTTALNQEPLQKMDIEAQALEELIKKRDTFKVNPLFEALGAAATFMSQDDTERKAIDIARGAASSAQSNELDAIKEALKMREKKSDIAQARGLLAAKGVDAQIIEPKYIQEGERIIREGDLYREPTQKGNDKAKIAEQQKEIAKGKIKKMLPYLGQKNIPGVGELEGSMSTGISAFFQKGKENKEAVNIIRNQINDLGYAAARANDPSGRLSDADVRTAGAKYGVGPGEQEDRIIQGTVDMLDDLIVTYPQDEELKKIREDVISAQSNRRSGGKSSSFKYEDSEKEKRYQEWKARNGK